MSAELGLHDLIVAHVPALWFTTKDDCYPYVCHKGALVRIIRILHMGGFLFLNKKSLWLVLT